MAAPQRRWAAELLHVWFHELTPRDWFGSSARVDALLRKRFGRELVSLSGQPATRFLDDPWTALAAVLLFDQVPRNLHRESAKAFACDPLARGIAQGAIARGWDRALTPQQRQFLAMPLQHSEAIADQRRSLAYFTRLGRRYGAPFARDHWRMIARFGRFPHRNAVLGRASTAAEKRAVAAGFAW
ncbi:MAG: hypothetical protein B7Z08_05300 [Sphingomonadales bacterium 32-68-7]|nr:MAG: hypothetical protein B7Z33_00875 [Sphingomonadales bacterium 12-68-11]OYX09417.1 MAG: hypothetical protein B7Z08_05300 [Sphingomonadales bacterium 32-68-7]